MAHFLPHTNTSHRPDSIVEMVNLPVLLIIDENFNTAIEKGQPADHEIIAQTVFIKNPNIKNHTIKNHHYHARSSSELICLSKYTH